MIDSSKILFRASGVYQLMTDAQKKGEPLSKGCKTALKDIFVQEKYKRKEELAHKFLEKGNERERDAIKLFSESVGREFIKNDVRLYNDFIQGEPDLFDGKIIHEAEETIDTKVSWSAFTFFRAQEEVVDKSYYWQGQSYMALTGAKKHTVAYCLINGLPSVIMDEKRRAAYQMGVIDMAGNNNPDFKAKCRQIEINHIFDINSFVDENPYFEFDNELEEWSYDIPKEERLFTFAIDRNEEDIARIYAKVKECRVYMDKFLFKIKPAEVAKKKIKRIKELQTILNK